MAENNEPKSYVYDVVADECYSVRFGENDKAQYAALCKARQIAANKLMELILKHGPKVSLNVTVSQRLMPNVTQPPYIDPVSQYPIRRCYVSMHVEFTAGAKPRVEANGS